MSLQLKRPIVFIDLETTGMNLSTDRIVEIAIIKVFPDGAKTVKQKLLNPQMPIPKNSSEIHGITDDKVKDAPTFKQVANELKQFIDDSDFSGYNSNRFDIPLLMEEFLRAGMEIDMTNRKLVDVQHIFHMMEKRTLGAAYKFYCEKELEDAHSAEADASATWEILQAQIIRYQHLGNTLDTILQFTGEESNPSMRLHSERYGGSGSCAWRPSKCSVISRAGIFARTSRCCRCSKVRFRVRWLSTRPSLGAEPAARGVRSRRLDVRGACGRADSTSPRRASRRLDVRGACGRADSTPPRRAVAPTRRPGVSGSRPPAPRSSRRSPAADRSRGCRARSASCPRASRRPRRRSRARRSAR